MGSWITSERGLVTERPSHDQKLGTFSPTPLPSRVAERGGMETKLVTDFDYVMKVP